MSGDHGRSMASCDSRVRSEYHANGRRASAEKTMDERMETELESAVFRRLVSHLRNRTDVQNIDMMITAGFCRNCLGDWYREAAAERGIEMSKRSEEHTSEL